MSTFRVPSSLLALVVVGCAQSGEATKSAPPPPPPPAVVEAQPPPPAPGAIATATATATPQPSASAPSATKGDDAKRPKSDKDVVGRAPAATATTTMQKPKCNCTPGDPTCNC